MAEPTREQIRAARDACPLSADVHAAYDAASSDAMCRTCTAIARATAAAVAADRDDLDSTLEEAADYYKLHDPKGLIPGLLLAAEIAKRPALDWLSVKDWLDATNDGEGTGD